jgi:hypothetical protein
VPFLGVDLSARFPDRLGRVVQAIRYVEYVIAYRMPAALAGYVVLAPKLGLGRYP